MYWRHEQGIEWGIEKQGMEHKVLIGWDWSHDLQDDSDVSKTIDKKQVYEKLHRSGSKEVLTIQVLSLIATPSYSGKMKHPVVQY